MAYIKDKKQDTRHDFLAKNVIWLTMGRIFTRVLAIIALPVITIYLDPKSFGIIALFIVEASFLSGLYSLGLSSFAGRMIYKYHHKNTLKYRQYLGVCLFYIAIFSCIGVCFSIPFAKSLKNFILKDVDFPYLFLFYIPLAYAFLEAIYGFVTNSLLNLQMNKKVFLCDTTENLLLIPIQIIGLIWFGFTWVQIVILHLVVRFLVTLFAIILIKNELAFSIKRLRIIKHALRYSLPYVPLNFSSWIQQQIDKIFLGRMQSISFVGVYSVGAKISSAFSFFSRPISTSVKPEISKRLDKRDPNVQSDITDFYNLFFHFSLLLIFIISIFSREIISVLANTRYLAAYKVIPFLLFAYMFAELSGIFHLKIIYKNKTVFFPVIIFFGGFLNALLNFLMIPRLGLFGAAIATVSSNFIILMISYVVSQKLHVSFYNMIRNLSVFAIAAIAIFLIQHMVPISVYSVLFKICISAIYAAVVYMYMMRRNRRFQEMVKMLLSKIPGKFAWVTG